ncbi:hypothetical protein K491DRAFT_576987, partial [Lophiostoma macrostomum CBS 122681]
PSPNEAIAHDDLCPICHLLLYSPVLTSCSHTLCASCMAQWADASSISSITPSSLDLDLTHFDPTYDALSELANLQAPCPMCRTPTTAEAHTGLGRDLEARYPATYAQRRVDENADRGDRLGRDGGEGVTILIGNRHRLEARRGAGEEGRESERERGRERVNRHDWTFFVRLSRLDIVQEVEVYLHPTFRPPSVTLRQPPFEVRRLGWGYFKIEATVVLKEGYRWVKGGNGLEKRRLILDWMLNFDGDGGQGRFRAKVERV